MNPVDIIVKKRDGRELSRQEIDFFIQGLTSGRIPDYQVAAWAMAVFFRGMSDREALPRRRSCAEARPHPSVRHDRTTLSPAGATPRSPALPVRAWNHRTSSATGAHDAARQSDMAQWFDSLVCRCGRSTPW